MEIFNLAISVTLASALVFWLEHPCKAEPLVDYFVYGMNGQEKFNFTRSEEICMNLGYDGLAVASFPEAYRQLLLVTAELRDTSHSSFYYVGIRKQSETEQFFWDDGTAMAEDTPLMATSTASGVFGRLFYNGKITFGAGNLRRFAVCGKHAKSPSSSSGSSAHGQEPTDLSSNISVTSAPSYMGCAVVCVRDTFCRAAVFNFDLFTCTTLGPGSYTTFQANPQVSTFIRDGFSV